MADRSQAFSYVVRPRVGTGREEITEILGFLQEQATQVNTLVGLFLQRNPELALLEPLGDPVGSPLSSQPPPDSLTEDPSSSTGVPSPRNLGGNREVCNSV
ncbi:hypothetical protein K3495_g9985 [Podosphaera aphanis]|nr:hypothetical protein K3495_g9985 [Podosphaera aphanis]